MAESCSRETLYNAILELTQFLLNRAHLCPRWLLRKSWMLLQCQVVKDKQLMQRMLPNCSKFPSRNVQMFGYVFHDTSGQKSWDKIEEPVVLLERNLYSHPLARLPRERQFEEALLELWWEKIPHWECMLAHRKQWLFLSESVDDIKISVKVLKCSPRCWTRLHKKWLQRFRNLFTNKSKRMMSWVQSRRLQAKCRKSRLNINKSWKMERKIIARRSRDGCQTCRDCMGTFWRCSRKHPSRRVWRRKLETVGYDLGGHKQVCGHS